jgi:hypothetical protein
MQNRQGILKKKPKTINNPNNERGEEYNSNNQM